MSLMTSKTDRNKGGRPAKDHLRRNKRTGEYWVRWVVPPRLKEFLDGKGTLLKPLGTKDYQEARRRSFGPNAECSAILEDAERRRRGEPEPVFSWPVQPGQPFAAQLRGFPPPDSVVAAGERYQAFMQREHDISIRRLRGEPEPSAEFESIIETWITKQQPRASSVVPYRSVMRQLAKWLGHSDATEVSQPKLREYEKHLYEGRRNTTVKNHLTIIKGLFDFAFREGLIPSDPAAVLTSPKTKSDKRAFSPDERKTLLIEARKAEPLIHWATWISAFSGARLSEITTANKSDIEFEADYVVLSVPSDRAKNGKHRRVPLHSAIIRERFRDYLDTVPDGGPLFPDKVGWNHSSLLNEWMRELGITDRNVTFHSHRHTFYSFANELIDGANERIPERFAEAIAGHSSGRASRRYGHIPIATLAAYVERIPDPTTAAKVAEAA
jgi:integrase